MAGTTKFRPIIIWPISVIKKINQILNTLEQLWFYDEFVKMQCFDSLCLEKNVAMYMIDYTYLLSALEFLAFMQFNQISLKNAKCHHIFWTK